MRRLKTKNPRNLKDLRGFWDFLVLLETSNWRRRRDSNNKDFSSLQPAFKPNTNKNTYIWQGAILISDSILFKPALPRC